MGDSCAIHGRAKLELGVPRGPPGSGRWEEFDTRKPSLKPDPYTVHLNQLLHPVAWFRVRDGLRVRGLSVGV
jgi:hypothetical protein